MRLLFLAMILGAAIAIYLVMFRKPATKAAATADAPDPGAKAQKVLDEVTSAIKELKETPVEKRAEKVAEIIKESSLTPEVVKQMMNEIPVMIAQESQQTVLVPESFASLPSAAMLIDPVKSEPVVNASPLRSVVPDPAPVIIGIAPSSWDSPRITSRVIKDMVA